tara:strand:- start:11450 stop:12154 length:705 start_codon:yes stop_codon:yes gene_type:complete
MEVTLISHMGSDISVVNAARVSFNKEHSRIEQSDKKLIKYLAKHNHWTPFAHTSLQFRIKAPVFVARQLGKHQVGLVWNEISRRYVDYEPEFYYPDQWRGRPKDKKQGSSGEVIDINPSTGTGPAMTDDYHHAVRKCAWTYKQLLHRGVAPEMARMVLPQSMFTEWYWTGSLYAFSRVCLLRLSKDAQEETREVASKIAKYCLTRFPISWKMLMGEPEEFQDSGFTDDFGVYME